MASPRRTSRVGSVVSDVVSSIESPDPLNASSESVPWPSVRRMTRSATRSQQTRSFMSLAGSDSPRKQTFHLDLGNGTKTPSKLRVTVETETPELNTQDSIEEYKDTKRTLFNATPTPKRKRAATTTTTVPLRDDDAPGVKTPKRRGRPKRAATPMKPTSGNKRARLTPTPEEEDEAIEKATPKSNTRKTKKAAGTPGRKRKAPFVPQETITYAESSPPKRARTSQSASPDLGPDNMSVASSEMEAGLAEDTVAQEDFSMIFADSLHSLRHSVQQQETQEIGEATSLIIENALEELRQSRGEGQSMIEPASTMGDMSEEPAQAEDEVTLVIAPADEAAEQPSSPVGMKVVETAAEETTPEFGEMVEQPSSPISMDAAETAAEFDDALKQPSSPNRELVEVAPEEIPAEPSEVVEQPTSPVLDLVDDTAREPTAEPDEVVDQPEDRSKFLVDMQSPKTTALVEERVTEVASEDMSIVADEEVIETVPEDETNPADEHLGETAAPESEDPDSDAEAEESSRSRSFGLNYADFSSSVTTKRRSSPRGGSSPIRPTEYADDYEDSFSEIPQAILNAAAPSGVWPPEHRQNDSPTPMLAPRPAPVDLGPRPSLSPIVRAGRVLQSVTSDDASPQSRQNSLGSPFRPTVASTPAQREKSPAKPQEPQPSNDSATSKKSWLGNIVEAGRTWFSPTRSTPTGANAQPNNVSEPLSTTSANQDDHALGGADDEDIWAIEAEREDYGSVGRLSPQQAPQEPSVPQTSQEAPVSARKESVPRRHQQPFGRRSISQGSFASKAKQPRRSAVPESWKRQTQINNPESEASEYSMLAPSPQKQPTEHKSPRQSGQGNDKPRKDLIDFFSSPALLPGAENAQQVLERRRMEIVQQKQSQAQAAQQPYVLPTTTMFPSERRQMPFQASTPMTAASSRHGEPTPELTPAQPTRVDPLTVVTAERNMALHQGRHAFRGSLAKAKAKHAASGAKGPLPPFAVDLSGVRFPAAVDAATSAEYTTHMTREELEKWSKDPSSIVSSSPTGRLRYRSEPNRHASPTKSCLRSPTKPRTPGPRLQWGSDVLSPEAQAEKRTEKRVKQQFLSDLQANLYNPQLMEEFGSSPPEQEEIQPRYQHHHAEAEEIEDVEMTDASFTERDDVASSPPAQETDVAATATDNTQDAEWSERDWRYLDELIDLRRKGQFPLEMIPPSYESTARWLVGRTFDTHGERLTFNPMHISIVDAFKATTNTARNDENVASAVASLIIAKQLHNERREPKRAYRHRNKIY